METLNILPYQHFNKKSNISFIIKSNITLFKNYMTSLPKFNIILFI